MIFTGADATGFEEDARLTAMWLWTLSTNADGGTGRQNKRKKPQKTKSRTSGKLTGGYVLEYDAARKIAQGLGAHLETLTSMVEVKGDKARLLPVSERTRYLFGKDEGKAPTNASRRRHNSVCSKHSTKRRGREAAGAKRQPQSGADRARSRASEHDPVCGRPQRRPQALPRRRRHRAGSALLAAGAGVLGAVSVRRMKSGGWMACSRGRRGWGFRLRVWQSQVPI